MRPPTGSHPLYAQHPSMSCKRLVGGGRRPPPQRRGRDGWPTKRGTRPVPAARVRPAGQGGGPQMGGNRRFALGTPQVRCEPRARGAGKPPSAVALVGCGKAVSGPLPCLPAAAWGPSSWPAAPRWTTLALGPSARKSGVALTLDWWRAAPTDVVDRPVTLQKKGKRGGTASPVSWAAQRPTEAAGFDGATGGTGLTTRPGQGWQPERNGMSIVWVQQSTESSTYELPDSANESSWSKLVRRCAVLFLCKAETIAKKHDLKSGPPFSLQLMKQLCEW